MTATAMTATAELGPNLTRLLETVIIGNHNELLGRLNNIMSAQEDFDAKITAANAAIDAVGVAVAAEAAQVAAFIAANPSVDTSALSGVVTRLEALDESVNTVFDDNPTPPPPAEEPVDPNA